jgi:hypothetical protein
MDLASVPDVLEITMEAACDISLECWRLTRAAVSAKEGNDSASVRYSARRITEALKTLGLETIDLTGRKYDAGLAPEVLNVILDDTVPKGELLIEERSARSLLGADGSSRPGKSSLSDRRWKMKAKRIEWIWLSPSNLELILALRTLASLDGRIAPSEYFKITII